MANELINIIHKENKLSDQLALNIQYKIRLMKEEIVNIKYAIHWAKAGIINSLILSNLELKLAIDTIENENLPYSTPEEALDFANVKIISNNKCLLYIVYIPLTTLDIYDKLIIKPVKRNNKINEIENENIIKNHDSIFSIVNNCKTVNSLSICSQNNIKDISNSMCLPNLLKSRLSKCNKSNNQHILTIQEISKGVILLNQFNGDVEFRNESQPLNGTYLIKFSNMSLTINNTIFISQERSTLHVMPAILQPMPQEEKFKEVISLLMMKDINIDNIDQIELLHNEKNIQQITNYTLMIVIAIITIASITVITCSKWDKKIRIINNTTNVEEEEVTKHNTTIITLHEKPDKQHVTSNATVSDKKQPVAATPNMIMSDEGQVPTTRRKFYETPFF